MKVKYLIKSLLCISFIFCLYACRKYKTTTITGKLVNKATGQGIANNKIALNAYALSGGELPKKVESQLIATTDGDGNFSFIFDAYTTKNNKKEVNYGVEMINEKYYLISQLSDVISRPGEVISKIDLTDYFSDDLIPSENVGNLGKDNEINLNVVLAGRFYFQLANVLLSDSMLLSCSNKYLIYKLYSFSSNPEIDNEYLGNYYFLLATGENTIRRTIYKNGQINIIDTTIYVEPKDYHINFHY